MNSTLRLVITGNDSREFLSGRRVSMLALYVLLTLLAGCGPAEEPALKNNTARTNGHGQAGDSSDDGVEDEASVTSTEVLFANSKKLLIDLEHAVFRKGVTTGIHGGGRLMGYNPRPEVLELIHELVQQPGIEDAMRKRYVDDFQEEYFASRFNHFAIALMDILLQIEIVKRRDTENLRELLWKKLVIESPEGSVFDPRESYEEEMPVVQQK